MEDPSSVVTLTTDSCLQTTKNGDRLKNADQDEEDHQKRTARGHGRWCTSSVRSRSSTSFLIHNLLISCSGGASDMPATTTSPPSSLQVPVDHRDDDNEDTSNSSSNESCKSGSCSPRDARPVAGHAVNGTYSTDDHYGPIKRRKCTADSFKRRSAKKKDIAGSANASDDSDNERGESKKITVVLNKCLHFNAIDILSMRY